MSEPLRKRWHLYLIIAVLALTAYNILPTIFYYSNPLKSPVDAKDARQVSEQIALRVNELEPETLSWLQAFSKTLNLKPKSITPVEGDPGLVQIEFNQAAQANLFRKYLPRAGALVPFVPSQLTLGPQALDQPATTVLVERKISTRFNEKELGKFFTFSEKWSSDGEVTPFYRSLIDDRAVRLAESVGGVSEPARLVLAASDSESTVEDAVYVALAHQIVEFDKAFGIKSPITQRYYASFTQVEEGDHAALIHGLASRFEQAKHRVTQEIDSIELDGVELLELAEQQRRSALDRQRVVIDEALALIRTHAELFRAGKQPLTDAQILARLEGQAVGRQRVDLDGRNPFIEAVVIDWSDSRLLLPLYPEVDQLRTAADRSEGAAFSADKLNRLLINEIANVGRMSDEAITPSADGFTIVLDQLVGSQSVLALHLGAVANQKAQEIQHSLTHGWNPESVDFARDLFPIADYATYQDSPVEQKKLGLVVYAPAAEEGAPLPGFRMGSIYVIARGLGQIDQKIAAADQSSAASQLRQDFLSLRQLLAGGGFVGYPAAAYGFPSQYKDDFIFELDDYYGNLLLATREEFKVNGTQRFAVLEFTDYEQRLLKLNEIQTEIHEDLVKWSDEYKAAQVDPDLRARYSVPAPTRSILLSNLKLSAVKYFRGDNRKILKWGLDLSGGKSVTIGLRDRQGHPVTDTADLREASNQLYTRVNKMGVSEVEIRTEGNHLVLNFPGAQALSASELVKGSTMFFHIVNEKFSPINRALAPSVNLFLQEVWNEAVVTGRKDMESVNQIAWELLGGELDDEGLSRPRSEAAQTLWDHGLRLADPDGAPMSSTFDDTFSKVAMFRGESFVQWHGQPTPLMFVFQNYALDGTNLQNVHAQYDPSKGNTLVFGVSRSGITSDGTTLNPQADFFAWTSQFAKDRVLGTPNELYSRGEGWRMAVILNGSVISAPHLTEPLRDHASITGNFSQREINQLVADFKAGSLTFTPRILSERNVSPDLGQEERMLGILAAAVGLAAVIALMTAYYRFAGVIASCAVLLNLLIMWGVLQNLGAALTLPGIAGIILTVGMAVDANVLVFERIREEHRNSGRLSSAVNAGYRRAFSAIIDSNLTTLIAAVILLQFDAGPIKGFAITLIIGIASSMFTALFMTRYFFAGWVQNPKHRELRMGNLFGKTRFNFVSKAKLAVVFSVILITVGGVLLINQRHTVFGMDFTGGYSLSVALEEKMGANYRQEATDALLAAGATLGDLQVRELNRPSHLRIQLGMGLEQAGGPLAALPEVASVEDPVYPFESNPRIVWVVQALEAKGLTLQPATLYTLENHWNVMSGQFSGTMRNQAILGLGLALLAILVYITFRFEFKYAISAIVALAHDLLITVGVLAIFREIGLAVQIDLQVIGALMTIIGYSLNDTIVIFDRIREEGRILRKLSFAELVNHSLNVTLNRTLMTSSTTLLVLLALVFLGGSAIFDFALVMSLGVIFGTFSSLFIAAPVLLYFHRKESQSGEANAMTKA